MRAFIGVDLDDESTLSALDEVRAALGAPPRTNSDHFTLAFLGEIGQEQAERAARHLDSIEFEAFEIEIATLGAFSSRTRPRIVWAGIRNGSERLRALAGSVDAAIAPLGFSRGRRFVPHITVFRVKSKSAQVAAVLAKHESTVFGTQRVDAVSLKRSDPLDGRHVHTTLHTVGASG